MSTYTVLDDIHHARGFVKNIPTDAYQLIIADDINGKIWKAYPWRWSTVALTAIPLVDSTQDYSSAPTDYFRLLRARIVRTDSSPHEVYEDLDVVTKLQPHLWPTSPRLIKAISYEGHLDRFRLERAVQVTSPSSFEVQGEYQKVTSKITNTSNTLPFPDQYFSVFVEGIKWRFYEFADDARAGTAKYDSEGNFMCTGQAGVFYGELFNMASEEGYAAGDPIAPDEPLNYE